MDDRNLKVGELAERTGLSVRALHHYDHIGLLTPASRTASGHRLYGVVEVCRLQQIRSLQTLGLTLEEIRACLDGSGMTLVEVVSLHLDALDQAMRRQRQLRGRLARMRDAAERAEALSLEELIDTLEATTTMEEYYTPEQLEQLAARRELVGDDRIQEIQSRWESLIPGIQAAIDRGAAPDDADVQALAREWRTLTKETVEGFTGGDPGLGASLRTMWQEKPEVWDRYGMSPDLISFIGRAVAGLDG